MKGFISCNKSASIDNNNHLSIGLNANKWDALMLQKLSIYLTDPLNEVYVMYDTMKVITQDTESNDTFDTLLEWNCSKESAKDEMKRTYLIIKPMQTYH